MANSMENPVLGFLDIQIQNLTGVQRLSISGIKLIYGH